MEALLRERPDLAGLPMAMGDACRTKGDRAKFFTQALILIKQARNRGGNVVTMEVPVQVAVPQTVTTTQRVDTPSPLPPTPAGSAPVLVGPQSQQQEMRVKQQRVEHRVEQQFVMVSKLQPNTDPDAFWRNSHSCALKTTKPIASWTQANWTVSSERALPP